MAYFTQIRGITNSIAATTVDSSGVGYSGSNPFPVAITSGSANTTATNIVDSTGIAYTGSNPVPVVITSGASATTAVNIVDSSGVAYSGTNPVPVGGSVAVSGVTGSIGATILNGEGVARDSWLVSGITNTIASNLVDSSGIAYSGTNPVPVIGTMPFNILGVSLEDSNALVSVAVSGSSSSIGATILNGEGLARDSWLVSGITNTIATANVDSSGIQYSGSNPFPFSLVTNATSTVNAVLVDSTGIYRGTLPVAVVAGSAAIGSVTVNGSLNSVLAVGITASDAADVGDAPIKIGGIARTANPTAVAAGDRVSATMDDLGRQLIRPVQVRDLISTAYVNKTTGSTFGTETTLFAGATSTYHDLIYILASNDSTAAIGVDVRGTTGGNILMHLEIPANSTTGLSLPVPLPAGDVGASWTIDLPDVTGTNVYVSALFSKEV